MSSGASSDELVMTNIDLVEETVVVDDESIPPMYPPTDDDEASGCVHASSDTPLPCFVAVHIGMT